MAEILKLEFFGAYAKFRHAPSTKETASVAMEILNNIAIDIRKAKGVLISIDRYDVIYRTPDDDVALESLFKERGSGYSFFAPEIKWTFGIKAELSFIVHEEDQNTAFSNCRMLLQEGKSPNPYRTID